MRLKAFHKKNLVKAKKIIADSIIPQVYSINTPKDMFDSLAKIFEEKSINQMKCRNSVILQEVELDQYFSKKGLGDKGR